MKIAHIIY